MKIMMMEMRRACRPPHCGFLVLAAFVWTPTHCIQSDEKVQLCFTLLQTLCQCNLQVDDDDEDDNDDEDDHDAADDDPERQQFLPKARLVYNQAGVQGSSSRASISRAEPFQNIQPQSLEGQNILQGA